MNEPVAWISVLGIDHINQKFTDVRVSLTKTDVADIPLYTHPAKELDEQFKEGFEVGKEEGWKAHKFHHTAKTPLLEQEIKFILGNGQCWQGEDCSMPNLMYIIRAVEAAHGIGINQDE